MFPGLQRGRFSTEIATQNAEGARREKIHTEIPENRESGQL